MRIHYWTPSSGFHAVNRLKTGSQSLIQTGINLSNRIRPKTIYCPEGAPRPRLWSR